MKELKVLVKGFDRWTKEAFEEEIAFELVRSSNESDYGNKHYMSVHRPKWKKQNLDDFVDVRYAGTLDLKKLAKSWLEQYFGENLKSWEVV